MRSAAKVLKLLHRLKIVREARNRFFKNGSLWKMGFELRGTLAKEFCKFH
jgi:hypothetical protein